MSECDGDKLRSTHVSEEDDICSIAERRVAELRAERRGVLSGLAETSEEGSRRQAAHPGATGIIALQSPRRKEVSSTRCRVVAEKRGTVRPRAPVRSGWIREAGRTVEVLSQATPAEASKTV